MTKRIVEFRSKFYLATIIVWVLACSWRLWLVDVRTSVDLESPCGPDWADPCYGLLVDSILAIVMYLIMLPCGVVGGLISRAVCERINLRPIFAWLTIWCVVGLLSLSPFWPAIIAYRKGFLRVIVIGLAGGFAYGLCYELLGWTASRIWRST
ncbi:MAG TPA: hypothetical protein PKA55_17680 [Rhodoblastus sp.]|nr:hypothetical protein [Rhodoblastus sp.]